MSDGNEANWAFEDVTGEKVKEAIDFSGIHANTQSYTVKPRVHKDPMLTEYYRAGAGMRGPLTSSVSLSYQKRNPDSI